MTITENDIDDIAAIFEDLLDACGAEDIDRAGLVIDPNQRGPLARAIRQRFKVTDQEAQDTIDDALGGTLALGKPRDGRKGGRPRKKT